MSPVQLAAGQFSPSFAFSTLVQTPCNNFSLIILAVSLPTCTRVH